MNYTKGYVLTVYSSEGDSENNQEHTVGGLQFQEAKFIVEALNLFKNKKLFPECFGNMKDEEFSTKVTNLIDEKICDILNKYNVAFLFKQSIHANPVVSFQRLLGISNDYLFRSFEAVNIYFVPEDIKDVTHQFKKEFTHAY